MFHRTLTVLSLIAEMGGAHVQAQTPSYTNDMVGGNAFGSVLPQLSDDAGTPFAVVVIPVDQSLAIKGNGARQ